MMNSKQFARLARNWLGAFVDPRRLLGIPNLARYFADWYRYNRLAGAPVIQWQESYPCLSDWVAHTPFDPHYFYQTHWAAQKLACRVPNWHMDIGSSVTMISVISAFVPTIFLDYRPLKSKVAGLWILAGDLLSLPFADNSVPSLSCLHVIEHIGLGRYGEPLDPWASAKAAQELERILAPGGQLLLSIPLGRERVQFNAHRVFAPETVLKLFADLTLVDFALVDDQGVFHVHANPAQASNYEYACGMFEFVK